MYLCREQAPPVATLHPNGALHVELSSGMTLGVNDTAVSFVTATKPPRYLYLECPHLQALSMSVFPRNLLRLCGTPEAVARVLGTLGPQSSLRQLHRAMQCGAVRQILLLLAMHRRRRRIPGLPSELQQMVLELLGFTPTEPFVPVFQDQPLNTGVC
jgi:hypothetical protein